MDEDVIGFARHLGRRKPDHLPSATPRRALRQRIAHGFTGKPDFRRCWYAAPGPGAV